MRVNSRPRSDFSFLEFLENLSYKRLSQKIFLSFFWVEESHYAILDLLIINVFFIKISFQKVKQGSRGMKTAYKGFKSKLRDRTPPNSSHQYGNHSQSHDGGHHSNSAPNSPVFTKRPQTEYSYNQNHRKPNTMLQSNSLMNNSNFTNNNHINKSPTVSQPSSNSSSEMNILQELQQHALFKMPAVDRSVSG